MRAEQVRDEAEEAAVARADVEDRLDRGLGREARAHRDVRHPRGRARSVGDVDDVDAAARAARVTWAVVFDRSQPGRRRELDRDRELAARDPARRAAALRERRSSPAAAGLVLIETLAPGVRSR